MDSGICIDNFIISSMKKYYLNDYPDFCKTNDIHERTSVFRIGYYLQDELKKNTKYNDYIIDSEYNRRMKDIKLDNDFNRIYPDLIIHKRNSMDNLAAMEFKRNNNSLRDKEKLEKIYKESYNYKNVYFIIINKKEIYKYVNNNWNLLIKL